jgi:chromosome segregation ATPase
MGTNGIDIDTETMLDDGALRVPRPDRGQVPGKRTLEDRIPDAGYLRSGSSGGLGATDSFALAPLVDRIAYSMARGLVVAMKELEEHIASETRKVGDTVDRRLDILQANLQELSNFVGEQRAMNLAVQGQVHELSAGLKDTDARQTASTEALRKEAQEFSASVTQRIESSTTVLRESDARLAADIGALKSETASSSQALAERIDGICKDLAIQQEDLAAVKTTLTAFASRVDALVARLDRQAEAVRSMYTAYSQRETELEQLVDGLAKLRAFPTPLPSTAL